MKKNGIRKRAVFSQSDLCASSKPELVPSHAGISPASVSALHRELSSLVLVLDLVLTPMEAPWPNEHLRCLSLPKAQLEPSQLHGP